MQRSVGAVPETTSRALCRRCRRYVFLREFQILSLSCKDVPRFCPSSLNGQQKAIVVYFSVYDTSDNGFDFLVTVLVSVE